MEHKMKKLILLSLISSVITQNHAALPRLQATATSLTARLGKIVSTPLQTSRPFSASTPLKKTVSDTIWQTKENQVVRVMGDMHIPSDKPYFELLESFFKQIDKNRSQNNCFSGRWF